ncbi:MAG: DNA repair protein RecO [Gammaproteobacteria bacterium]|nr:MAG: DNA repair protein RecO [Gammaproteobacteria bacterium]
MRVQQQPAFILHHRHYSETSLLLDVFTPNYGRIGLIAKGARRPRSRLQGILKPFQPLLIGWSGRGELAVLTGAEADSPGFSIDRQALYCGFYMNELLMRLLHRHDPHEALYTCYRSSLSALRVDETNEAILRVFEKHLLREIGYGLVLDHDIGDNSVIRADALYDYIPERGPTKVANPDLNTRHKSIRLRGASLLALANETLNDMTALRETKNLMRTILTRHLGDKPLHSRRLFYTTTVPTVASAERKANT